MFGHNHFLRGAAVLLTTLACGWIGAPGYAQGSGGPPPPPVNLVDIGRPIMGADLPLPVLQQTLNLSSAQSARIDPILKQLGNAMRQVPPPPPDPAAIRATIARLHGLELDASNQMATLLSVDQQKALALLLKDANDFRLVGIPMPAGPALKLTPDQRGQIAKIADKAAQGIQQAINAGKAGGDVRPIVDQVTRILQQSHDAMLALLTNDQKRILGQFGGH
jgi:hypothetical protein